MDRVVGRTAGRQQADAGVDDRFLVHHPRHRAVIATLAPDLGQPVYRCAGQRRAQWGVGRDEARPRNVQPHQLQHHLVGVGGAVKGAGPGAVITCTLAFEQVGAGRLALGVELAHLLLFAVGEARGHRPRRNENRRKVTKPQRTDHQSRHDLVANPEQRHAIEHRMAHRHRRRKRDGVAAEQAEFHPVLTLGDPVAHRRNTPSHLRGRADFARVKLHRFGIAAIGLMRRKHVVVGGDNREVRPAPALDRGLVAFGRREAVGEIRARQGGTIRKLLRLALHQLEIALATVARPFDDPLGDPFDDGVEGHTSSPSGEGDHRRWWRGSRWYSRH